MTPQAFIAKWHGNSLSEKAGAQPFFLDLCDLLGVAKPHDPDNYCFERGATRTGAGGGWADVWKRNCFAWESKAPGKDLGLALRQLMTYALALDNPPLLVVSDRSRIEIHTHFTGTPSEVHSIELAAIGQPENLQKLRWLFDSPERFKPRRTTYAVTEEAAARMGELATRLTGQGLDPQQVAHFLIQCVFCMFSEDARLLPEKLFETVLDKSNPDGAKAQSRLTKLFEAMRSGGDFALETIPWFNGGLFKQIDVPPLTTEDVVQLLNAARMGWGEIEPAILGTLFERGLNPDMRSQLGAHYTDPATILKLIRPVIEAPLLAEWQPVKANIAALMDHYIKGGKGSQTAHRDAQQAFAGFIQRLKAYRVLDPACGSGNFLYLALKTLKDLEHRVGYEAEALGLHRELVIETSPANVQGIELNPYAAELARVTVWIGEIQWMLAHGYAIKDNPILQALDHIENRDAVLDVKGEGLRVKGDACEPEWPAVDTIVGNPPFLGDKKMRAELGDDYTEALRRQYEGRVPGGADFVTYWFEKARAQIEAGKAQRAGLVATNSIRGGASRKVLERIVATAPIFEAWSDEAWINNGAAVRVSLVCFGHRPVRPGPVEGPVSASTGSARTAVLDGKPVSKIHADLTSTNEVSGTLDLTQARQLEENTGIAFIGTQKTGAFDIPGELAREWLKQPNPNGQPNSQVVKPWANGQDLTRRPSDTWIVDFGIGLAEAKASLFEAPYRHLQEHVQVGRNGKRESIASKWWLHTRPRPDMRQALANHSRYIATPRVAKHRLFVWLSTLVLPDSRLTVIARSDDVSFGILSSRFHTIWSLATCSWHGVGNDPTYNAQSVFETFPFPDGLTPRDTAAAPERASPTCYAEAALAENIAAAAAQLNTLRETWLNPPEWVDWVRTPEEEQAGFPLRPVARPGHEAELKKRTLTHLYNARAAGQAAWLDHAHRVLDEAVANAYGWTDYTPEMADEEILKRLLALNLERSALQDKPKVATRR